MSPEPLISKLACKACGETDIFEILDLGNLPLAGDFRPLGEPNQLYPLAIDGCNACGLVQVREVVSPEILFGPDYSYASSSIQALVDHFEGYAKSVRQVSNIDQPCRLLEIGCNDGIFLAPLERYGYDVIGIDASDNVAELARSKGLRVYTGFFDDPLAKMLVDEYGFFDVVTCSNVFAHVPEIGSFLARIDSVLHPGHGEVWIEVQSTKSLYNNLQWDFFYHEHCFYWTIHSLERFLNSYGFKLLRFSETSMHGGGIRAMFTKSSEARSDLIISEVEATPTDWKQFAEACQHSRVVLYDVMSTLPIRVAFGAAGRATTLINWAGIGSFLDYAIDGNPLRIGKAIPGVNVPIISEADFLAQDSPPHWCLISAYSYFSEIRAKIKCAFPLDDTRLVVPLPNVTIT